MTAAATPDGAVPVAPRVHWIGALDPDLRRFDIILRSANGTSYNAYAVRGSQGVAIIDTVKSGFSETFFRRLESIASYDEITTVVLNHLEPDHSGALPELLRRARRATLLVSPQARLMLQGLFDPADLAGRVAFVGSGDHADLGDRQLQFLNTPYLHWPDTQCTWLAAEGILFSADFLGCHYCDSRLFNDAVGDFRFSFDYYYRHIMRPFGSYVRDALDLIEALPLRVVAPAHGPILRRDPHEYVARYRALAARTVYGAATKTLAVFYVSAYGATRRMAEAVVAGAESASTAASEVRISLHDLEGGEAAAFVDLIEEAAALVFGSPTINGDAVKPVWDLLSSLTVVDLKGKLGAAFGSYGWSGEAVPMIEERLRRLKLRVPLPGVRARLAPTGDDFAACHDLGREIALHLLGRPTPRTLDLAQIS
ncbi:FprA family A-type flavoprotein [Accumulibacter sp.]|uniref:FprA family A-type flavoprotein n=1 Tax=Accumulibacter sp. TaxID=2053492 RepID=UPI0025CD9821|nr:FprA family A-type flavoprotein [Accumulibacter sp.]MCM8611893.1 FprA family A-type flavoprotein [Accumulibacter sp.]MCM8635515.1 FprA family A-type flavoprotein [Accumulibacter sp.]MCM8639093.1 FprA family A-type flavoprotein [Accumulibacter sp.]